MVVVACCNTGFVVVVSGYWFRLLSARPNWRPLLRVHRLQTMCSAPGFCWHS